VTRYIHHKLLVASGASSIIDDAAISALHSYSQGNPRLIDNVMSYALDLGAQPLKTTIEFNVFFMPKAMCRLTVGLAIVAKTIFCMVKRLCYIST